MVKNIVKALLMGVAIAVVAAPAQAQDAERDAGRESRWELQSIVGSWIGIIDNGERVLMSFTASGTVLGSVQTEVKSTGPVLTPAHGAWSQVGGRRFVVTTMAIVYDINTGAHLGFGKLRGLLTLNKSAERISAAVTVDILAPDGTTVGSFPHTASFTRIKVEHPD
jgi:hypothetical protein